MIAVQRCRTLLLAVALLVPMLAAGFGAGAKVAAQEPVTLDLWMFVGSDPEDTFFPALQEAFQAAHPNITLEVTLIPEDQYVVKLDTALATLRTQASKFGSNLTTVQTRQEFTKNLVSTLQTGADNLVLADTNEEGANMLALQTRQQLSTTALALSAQADQAVLRLF